MTPITWQCIASMPTDFAISLPPILMCMTNLYALLVLDRQTDSQSARKKDRHTYLAPDDVAADSDVLIFVFFSDFGPFFEPVLVLAVRVRHQINS